MDIFDCSIYSNDNFLIRVKENKTHKELKEYLYNKYGKYKANYMLNLLILGGVSYLKGYLSVYKEDNSILNVKNCNYKIYATKRTYYNEYYIEKKFIYDKRKNSYNLKIIKNNNGIKEDISDEYNLMNELEQLIMEANNISIYFDVNIVKNDLIVIDGKMGRKEIGSEEISLYSSRSDYIELNSCAYQRLYIVKNDVNIIIGHITYNFRSSNISYFVNELYRGHRYATKALKLMLELIKNNVNFLENNLYIRVLSENGPSIKTANECALLVGEVFEDDKKIKKYLVNPLKKIDT